MPEINPDQSRKGRQIDGNTLKVDGLNVLRLPPQPPVPFFLLVWPSR
jgi:hypothetical protein